MNSSIRKKQIIDYNHDYFEVTNSKKINLCVFRFRLIVLLVSLVKRSEL